MSLAEIGGRIVNAAADAVQTGLSVARETLTGAALTNRPVDEGAARLVVSRAVSASNNNGDATPSSFTSASAERELRIARTGAILRNVPSAAQQQSPSAQSASESVLVQTNEVTIKRETTPASDPSEPPVERIVFDTGAGDDRLYAGGGRDRIYGGLVSDKRNAARDVAYAQAGEDTVAAGTNVVNVVLSGMPGGRALRVVGSAEFVERVERDIEFMRSSPDGRQMLEAFDRAYDTSRSPLRALPLVGPLFRDGNTVTIQELTEEDNGFADWSRRTTGGPHPFLDAQGNPGASDNATISYNTRLNQVYDPDPNKASDRWKYFDPVVVLYHEMSHSYNIVTGAFQSGTYNGSGPDGGVIPNSERQAVGLPNSGVLFDNDFDASTPRSRDNPRAQTENGLRAEMNRPARPTYGDS